MTILAATVAATLTAGAGAAPRTAADYNALQLRILKPESYVDLAGVWKGHRIPIPVCWESLDQGEQRERAWVEGIVAAAIEAPTAVRFGGSGPPGKRWPGCAAGSLGIRVAVADIRPWSEVGQQWEFRDGGRTERPTRMTLNFTLGGEFAAYCSQRKEQCVKVLAVHEFMHAIGFLHEHLRDDAPKECRQTFAHEPDFPGHDPLQVSLGYDQWSIMNYCESIYRHPIRLSALDIIAVNHLYAARTAAGQKDR